jgi:hypothetical protein
MLVAATLTLLLLLLPLVCIMMCAIEQVQLVLKQVKMDPEAGDLHRELHALSPQSIYWHDTPDRYETAVFHDMAAACSSSHCLHSAHSFNWVQQVSASTGSWDVHIVELAPSLLCTSFAIRSDTITAITSAAAIG